VYFRKLCQKRWLYCDRVTLQLHGLETWKQFFISRTWQEHAKTRAKPEDFNYKEIPVAFGIVLDTLEETLTLFFPVCAVLHSHLIRREL
jgi:F-box/WD-40 domain protein 12/13/14/15/16/17/19